MSNTVVCSVKQAMELMAHMNEDDMVTLTINNIKSFKHDVPTKKIKKEKGEELIKQAEIIYYQNNDFFGRLSLHGIVRDNNIVHNILFPQLE